MKLLIVLSIFLPLLAHSAQLGIVRPDKAIVYSDIQGKAPIGFIRKGTTVKIGDIAKYNNSTIATVVNGKIAYLKTKDLFLVDEFEYDDIRDTAISGTLQEYLYNAKFRSKSSLYATFGGFETGSNWEDLSQVVNRKSTNRLGTYFHGRFEYHPFFHKRLSLAGGVDYFSISDQRIDFESFGPGVDLLIEIYSHEYFFFGFQGSLHYSPVAKLNILGVEPRLTMIGTTLGFYAVRYFDSGFGLRGGVGHQNLNVESVDDLDLGTNEGFDTISIDELTITGFHIYLGLHFRI